MNPRLMVVAALIGLAGHDVRAYDIPGWLSDSRVRQVLYRPDEVVRIEAQRG